MFARLPRPIKDLCLGNLDPLAFEGTQQLAWLPSMVLSPRTLHPMSFFSQWADKIYQCIKISFVWHVTSGDVLSLLKCTQDFSFAMSINRNISNEEGGKVPISGASLLFLRAHLACPLLPLCILQIPCFAPSCLAL